MGLTRPAAQPTYHQLKAHSAEGNRAQLGMQMCANGLVTGQSQRVGEAVRFPPVTVPASKDLGWAVHGLSLGCWVTISSDLVFHTLSPHPA